jgi:hypothetical protein
MVVKLLVEGRLDGDPVMPGQEVHFVVWEQFELPDQSTLPRHNRSF